MSDRIVILDFGSQYTQLIGRRIRDMHVYCELLPWHAKKMKRLTSRLKASSCLADHNPSILTEHLTSRITCLKAACPSSGFATACKP